MLKTITLVFALLLAAPIHAAPLTATLMVTDRGNELFDAWREGKAISLRPVTIAKRGVFLSAVVFFQGCEADASGNCNATVDITAYDPNGDVYGELKGQELWQGKAAPAPGETQLSVSYMGLVIEPEDPAGAYRVVAEVHDHTSSSTARSVANFLIQ